MNHVRKGMLCVMLLAALAGSAGALDWSHSGFDQARNRMTTEPFGATLAVKAPSPVSVSTSELVSSPALAEGFLVIGGEDGKVRALHAATGAVLWTYTTEGRVTSSPAVDRGKVYVGSLDNYLYCLNLADGSLLWRIFIGGAGYSSPVVDGDCLYFVTGFPTRKVVCVDIDAVSINAEWQLDQLTQSSAAIAGDHLYVVTNSGSLFDIDLTQSGSIHWTFAGTGLARLSSPVVVNDTIFFATGGDTARLFSVDANQALWGANNWNFTPVDPAVPGGNIVNVQHSISSPCWNGAFLLFVVRFDYYINVDGDFRATPEDFVMNEYVVAVNPATHNTAWQTANGSLTVHDANAIPSLGLCPTPALLDGGSLAVVGSSLSANFRMVDASDGSVESTVALNAAGRCSPCAANGRIAVGTDAGSIYLLGTELNEPPAAPAGGFSPVSSDINQNTPTFAWNAGTDDHTVGANLDYTLRLDDDGEILMNWDLEATVTGLTSHQFAQPLVDNNTYTWAIRVEDEHGALSPWSATQNFSVNKGPDTPANFIAIPGQGQVRLEWLLGAGVDHYSYQYLPDGGSLTPLQNVGLVDTVTVNGLTNDLGYTFYLFAFDNEGDASNAAVAQVVPNPNIFIGGTSYATIEDALAAAQEGQTVSLGEGTFALGASLQVPEGVSLVGLSPRLTVLSFANTAGIVVNSDGDDGATVLGGFRLNGVTTGIQIGSNIGDFTVRNLLISGATQRGIDVGSFSAGLVENVTLLNGAGAAVYANGSTVTVNNSILQNNSKGLQTVNGGQITGDYNNVFGNATDYDGPAAAVHNFNMQALFANNHFQLRAGSRLIDGGDPDSDFADEPAPHGARVNVGAYGNNLDAENSAALTVAATGLPSGELDQPYSVTVSTAGGTPPLTWDIVEGILPAGLVLQPAQTGSNLDLYSVRIVGTLPGAPEAVGVFNFTLRAVDSQLHATTRELSIAVNFPASQTLHIATDALGEGFEGHYYEIMIGALNGAPPYTYAVVAGELPAGLTLDPVTGIISGILGQDIAAGFNFTIEVTDGLSNTSQKVFSLEVSPELPNAPDAGGNNAAGGSSGGGGCFIATAAYGSTIAPAVNVFRQYRDQYLLQSNVGCTFVKWYYAHSPRAAQHISQRPVLRGIACIALTPLLAYAWFMVNTGVYAQMLACIVLAGGCWLWLRRSRRCARTSKAQ